MLTALGGMTSHAAVVARGMGKCCVSGCTAAEVDLKAKTLKVGLGCMLACLLVLGPVAARTIRRSLFLEARPGGKISRYVVYTTPASMISFRPPPLCPPAPPDYVVSAR